MFVRYPLARKSVLLLVLCIMTAFSGAGCRPLDGPSSNSIAPPEGLKDINGTQLYYKAIGTGEPIFFLHGGPGGSHRYFLPHMQQLADEYQLVFYDQRGTGLSNGRLDLRAISIDQFVEDLEALRVAFGFEKISLVGHSWGAVIALFYAFKYQAHLNRLILVDPRPVTNAFLAEQGKTIQQRLQRLSPEAQQMLNTLCMRPSAELSAEARMECFKLDAALRFYDPTKALAMDDTTEENTAKNAANIRSLLTTSFNRRQKEIDTTLRTLSVPTVIIHGDFDPIPIGASEYIQQRIPASQLVIIKESGHFPFVEQPEMFFTAIRAFMRR
jgi:proline iminopeptidase